MPHFKIIKIVQTIANQKDTQMNILLTINDISITGGAERVCVNIANALAESGNNVEILSFYHANKSLPYDTKTKLTFMHNFGENILRDKMLSNPIQKLYFKNLHKIILALKVWKKYKHIDAIITNDWTYMPLFKHKNTRYIKIQHNRFEKYNKRNNLFDALVILSEREIQRWQRYHSNINAIPNFLPDIPQTSTNHSQKVVLSVGRLSSEKGFLRLLDIWKIVREHIASLSGESNANDLSLQNSTYATFSSLRGSGKATTKQSIKAIKEIDCHDFDKSNSRNDEVKNDLNEWKLIIVGDGVLKSEIESKINALNLGESVILKPFTKDIEREYLGASIYAMASHFEGFPMVLLESTSYGLAPLSFDIATGPSDIIEHNKSGFLIPDNDLEGYAKHLIALMSDESMRTNFGKEAKRIVSERFSKESVLQKWIEIFDENWSKR